MKTIYLEPDEEITSVVDMLTQTDAKKVALIVPVGAQLLQSSINMKLLRREANILEKDVTIVTADQLGRQLAEKADFKVKDKIDPEEVEDYSPEFVQEEEEGEDEDLMALEDEDPVAGKENMIDALVEEMEIDRNDQLEPEAQLVVNKAKTKPKRASIADIVAGRNKKGVSKTAKKAKELEEIIKEEVEGAVNIPIVSDVQKPKPAPPQEPEIDEDETDLEYESLARPDEEETSEPEIADDFDILKELETPDDDISELEQEPEGEEELVEPSIKKAGLFGKIFKNKIFYAVVAVIVIGGGIMAYNILPQAEVVIFPKTERVTFDLDIVGSKEISQIDVENKRVPIQSVQALKDLSREFPATGEKQLNEKAKGTVTIYNEYSSEPQALVASTRLLSGDDMLFRTVETITVPGAKIEGGKIIASVLDVEVVADQAGSEYNVGPSEFTIPGFEGTVKYAGFYGRSKEPLTGGSTEKVKVVTAKDLENAEETLLKEIGGVVKKALEEQIPTDLKLIEGAIEEEVISSSSSVEEDEEADTFVMEITAQSKALLFNEKDLNELVDSIVASKVEQDQVSLADTQQVSWDKPEIDWSASTISFSLHVQEDVAWQVDQEKLKNDLAGLNEIEATQYLRSLSNLKKAQVTFWPFWVRSIPDKIEKIEIITQ